MARGKKKPRKSASSARSPARKTVNDLIAEKQLVEVAPDVDTARHELEQAERNLHSARRLVKENPALAYTALYDAVRIVIQAHMRAHGLRPKPGLGGHIKTMSYAEAVLNAPPSPPSIEHLEELLERLRTTRHRLEYEGDFIGEAQVNAALEEAETIVGLFEERFREETE